MMFIPPTGGFLMKLEIVYTYQEDKQSDVQTSWTYLDVETDDLKKGISEAGKYFKRFKRENGWTSRAKLKEIRTIKNENDPIPTTIITASSRNNSRGKRSLKKSSSQT